jgi:S1-C subfamily serine protease
VIVEIEKGSAGARVGLEPGDLIVSVNRREITTLSEMEQAVRINDKSLRLNILRGNSALFLVLR